MNKFKKPIFIIALSAALLGSILGLTLGIATDSLPTLVFSTKCLVVGFGVATLWIIIQIITYFQNRGREDIDDHH